MNRRWIIPAATITSAFIWPTTAHAQTFTCWASNTDNWHMEQPDADRAAGYWPTWADCLAWRNGNPGPTYVWSYGPGAATTTTSSSTTTTTSTTVPETTTTVESTTTTSTSTTSSTTSTTTSTTTTTTTTTTTVPPTTTSRPVPTVLAATTTEPTTTTSSTTTTTTVPDTIPAPPVTYLVAVSPNEIRAGKVIAAHLAPGVTPIQAETVLIVNVAMQAVQAATLRKRKK